jgi:hypothetical protein
MRPFFLQGLFSKRDIIARTEIIFKPK